jgi:hypothetical protein
MIDANESKMRGKIRMDNVPVSVNHGASTGRHAGEPTASNHKRKRRGLRKVVFISIGVIVVVAIAVTAVLTVYRSSVGSLIDNSKYQAVFFTNGQVYFGKLQTVNNNYMKLTDIFYLQTSSTDSTNPQQTSTSTAPNVQLIKLGSEIHGPSDEMVISDSQILFFENLQSNGKVSQSITSYQK